MLGARTTLAGLPRDAAPGLVTRCIVESIAARVGDVVGQLAQLGPIHDIVLFGGAARMGLLARRLAATCGRPVRIGPAEAAAIGNAIVQGIAIGRYARLEDSWTDAPPASGGGASR